jgi:carbon-monoxide dehydrogenase medium subunit
MKPAPFAYVAPDSVAEAVMLLRRHGGEAKILAGGQSLVPMMNLRMARPAVLVDINRIAPLAGWRREDTVVRIGALTRQSVLTRDAHIAVCAPLLAEAARHIGHVATRNRGTIGGSLAHADPAAELPVCVLALDATLHVRSQHAARDVAAGDFFLDLFTTALAEDELLEAVSIASMPPGMGTSFAEISRRPGDFAVVAVACRLLLDAESRVASASIALGGVGARPQRAGQAETLLRGERAGPQLWRAAAAQAARGIEPGSDVHASAAYRKEVAAVLVERALHSAAARAEAPVRAPWGGP